MKTGNVSFVSKIVKATNEYNAQVEKKYSFKFATIEALDSRVDIKQILLINPIPVSLVAHMSRIPTDYAFWATIRSELEEEIAKMKHNYELWHAEKYAEVCGDEKTPRTATETYKESQIIVSHGELYKKKKAEIEEVESSLRKLKVLLKSLEMKKEMLQSIGAMVREEIGTTSMTDGAIMTSDQAGSNSLSDFKGTKSKRKRRDNNA